MYVKRIAGPDEISHEVGHALLGLHHLKGISLPALPVMTPSLFSTDDGFAALEFDAIRAVYRAGLRHGAARADFQTKGLIGSS